MMINTIANQLRTQRGEPLTIEMLQAELDEVKELRPKTIVGKRDKNNHMLSLEAAIRYKQKNNDTGPIR